MYTRCSEIVQPLAVTSDHETFTHDVYMSGAYVGTAGTRVRACTGRLEVRVTLNLLLEGYSGKEILFSLLQSLVAPCPFKGGMEGHINNNTAITISCQQQHVSTTTHASHQAAIVQPWAVCAVSELVVLLHTVCMMMHVY